MDEVGFDTLFLEGTGDQPYDYQRRLAADGLPELLAVPTGAGKTLAVLAAWLWRRRCHPDPAIRVTTPRWLVFCLPMRVLTEQTVRVAQQLLDATGFSSDVKVHALMGGHRDGAAYLHDHPEQDAVVVGTLDMLLGRAINRGYGSSRFAWPIDFALFNSGCHWVFDEVQLMGPALETSRQLDGLRRQFGTALPTSCSWMSATLPDDRLRTVDNSTLSRPIILEDADASGHLAKRLTATKLVYRLDLDPKDLKRRGRQIADALVASHQAASLSIAVHNTVAAARATHAALLAAKPSAEVTLLHSRFRPDDRRIVEDRSIAAPLGTEGRIVVATQVLEAGVDVSATLLFTEAAPWPSVVQRAGRCNRDGNDPEAVLLWAPPARPAPYLPADVDATTLALESLEATSQTVTSLRELEVMTTQPQHAVMRRADLLGLFDTAPDLAGNDVDVSSFIRVDDDVDVLVAWREMRDGGPDDDDEAPRPSELCAAPLAEVRALLAEKDDKVAVWYIDHLRERRGDRWRRARSRDDLRPGMVVVLDATAGRYSSTGGWDPTTKDRVEPVGIGGALVLVEGEEGLDDDPLSVGLGSHGGRWYGLSDHLGDVERDVRGLREGLGLDVGGGLSADQLDAATLAGKLHDIGKAHPVFQATLRATAADDGEAPADIGPWAKSGGSLQARHKRKGFRHELASALALLDAGQSVLVQSPEPNLVRYLVASHHGRVRLGIRGLPDEAPPPGTTAALGIYDGEELPEVLLPDGQVVPASILRLDSMLLGGGGPGAPSWTAQALDLRDRGDLGPFRLAFLETLVRLADWRASARAMGAGA